MWREGINRRRLLAAFGLSFAGTLRAAPQAPEQRATCVLTPVTGEGPYYFDPKLVRSEIAEHQAGTPLHLDLQVVSADTCTPIRNARVDVWHSNARGIYSGYESQRGVGQRSDVSAAGKTFLRGTQFTDREGLAVFRTIYPSWYYGRTPHIHFKVFLQPREVAVSQIYFPDDVSDRVYSSSKDYVARSKGRDTYNEGDMFMRGGRVNGTFCSVVTEGRGYRASVAIGIRES
jgi:protocatechuate 3,4-dioxygenase beta subunit